MRIPIRYNRFGRVLLTLLGAPPSRSYIDVRADEVHVQLGWLFRSTFPLASVVAVHPHPRSISLGVHAGFGRYRWLVNGAWSPLATITIGPTARCYMLGMPFKLRELIVSVDNPEHLRAELARAHAL